MRSPRLQRRHVSQRVTTNHTLHLHHPNMPCNSTHPHRELFSNLNYFMRSPNCCRTVVECLAHTQHTAHSHTQRRSYHRINYSTVSVVIKLHNVQLSHGDMMIMMCLPARCISGCACGKYNNTPNNVHTSRQNVYGAKMFALFCLLEECIPKWPFARFDLWFSTRSHDFRHENRSVFVCGRGSHKFVCQKLWARKRESRPMAAASLWLIIELKIVCACVCIVCACERMCVST